MLPWQCPIGHFLSLLANSQAMRNEKPHSCAGMQAMAGHPGTPTHTLLCVALKARQRDSENNPKGASRHFHGHTERRPEAHQAPLSPVLQWLALYSLNGALASLFTHSSEHVCTGQSRVYRFHPDTSPGFH